MNSHFSDAFYEDFQKNTFAPTLTNPLATNLGTKYDNSIILSEMIVGAKRKRTETELSSNNQKINHYLIYEKTKASLKINKASS